MKKLKILNKVAELGLKQRPACLVLKVLIGPAWPLWNGRARDEAEYRPPMPPVFFRA